MLGPRVGLLEDDPRVRARFEQAIACMPGWRLAFSVGSIAEAAQVLRNGIPDVLLVDLGLPDGSGLDVIRYASSTSAACQILVISVFGDDDKIFQSIAAGAAGYLLKGVTEDELVAHLHDLHAGGSPMSPKIARRVLSEFRGSMARDNPPLAAVRRDPLDPDLTGKEQEILGALALGHSYGEVAQMLGISLNTVRHHVKSIYGKLFVHSRYEAVRVASQRGLIDRVGSG
ncbi:LuxR family two component transcriptional regulator [Azonexus fungiphilus]|uniref:LuxR family two component transcriptional regulator n=1 Tax=Azonexus fungiphilus TaxID=146940 RepID=A0A495VQE2_9RHOO|nr:response regulator transcription factor [Azonexus fungiphilus]RKT50653.1 LuxR family two component transcriptional regulator [Azonexus fungiphilus]